MYELHHCLAGDRFVSSAEHLFMNSTEKSTEELIKTLGLSVNSTTICLPDSASMKAAAAACVYSYSQRES